MWCEKRLWRRKDTERRRRVESLEEGKTIFLYIRTYWTYVINDYSFCVKYNSKASGKNGILEYIHDISVRYQIMITIYAVGYTEFITSLDTVLFSVIIYLPKIINFKEFNLNSKCRPLRCCVFCSYYTAWKVGRSTKTKLRTWNLLKCSVTEYSEYFG